MRVPLTADRFLAAFFSERRHGAADVRRTRIDRTEADLRLAIELVDLAVLAEDDLVLLDAERQFAPIAAVARVLPLPLLPVVLEAYLTDPLYRPSERDEALERLATCAALVRRLAREPELLASTRQLRRVDERVRMESATLQPARRIRPGRRVRG